MMFLSVDRVISVGKVSVIESSLLVKSVSLLLTHRDFS